MGFGRKRWRRSKAKAAGGPHEYGRVPVCLFMKTLALLQSDKTISSVMDMWIIKLPRSADGGEIFAVCGRRWFCIHENGGKVCVCVCVCGGAAGKQR